MLRAALRRGEPLAAFAETHHRSPLSEQRLTYSPAKHSNPFKLDVPSAEAVTGIELFGVRARDDREFGVELDDLIGEEFPQPCLRPSVEDVFGYHV
jgi:hypothetical protein